MRKLLDRVRATTGIYASGFDPASIAGIAFPVLFVLIVGGAISAMIVFG